MATSILASAPRRADALRRSDRIFFGAMAAAVVALVFAGFARTYYLRGYFGSPSLTPLRAVHGAVFSAWILLFAAQTGLVAAGRTAVHRRLGVVGAVLALAVVVIGSLMAVAAAREGRAPPGIEPRAFLAIPLFDLATFAPLVAAGVYFRRRPETHKRLMLLATVSILGAAAARLPLGASLGPPFFFGVVDLLVLAGPAYDLVTRRTVHPAYVWGGLLVVASQPLRLALSGTGAWLAFADLLIGR